MMPMRDPAMREAEASAYGRMDQMLDGKADPKMVNLREGEAGGGRCADCVSFRPPDACATVAGKIAPEQVCDEFSSGEGTDEMTDNNMEEMS